MDQQYRIWAACDYTGNLTWNDNTVTSPPSANKGAVVAIVSTTNPAIAAGNIGYNNFSSPITSIALGADNKFYTGGFGKEPLNVAGTSFTNNGCTDIILSGGAGTTVNWGKSIGGSGCEEIGNFTFGSLMDVDKAGNLYISGIFENGATAGGVTVDGNGLWIGKLSTSTVATQEASPEPVTIAPNPANNIAQVETTAYLNGVMQMVDINGKVMLEQDIDHDIMTLQVSDIPAGIYFIALEKPGLARRVIKIGIAH